MDRLTELKEKAFLAIKAHNYVKYWKVMGEIKQLNKAHDNKVFGKAWVSNLGCAPAPSHVYKSICPSDSVSITGKDYHDNDDWEGDYNDNELDKPFTFEELEQIARIEHWCYKQRKIK